MVTSWWGRTLLLGLVVVESWATGQLRTHNWGLGWFSTWARQWGSGPQCGLSLALQPQSHFLDFPMLEVLWDFKGPVVIIMTMIYERVLIFEHQAQFHDRDTGVVGGAENIYVCFLKPGVGPQIPSTLPKARPTILSSTSLDPSPEMKIFSQSATHWPPSPLGPGHENEHSRLGLMKVNFKYLWTWTPLPIWICSFKSCALWHLFNWMLSTLCPALATLELELGDEVSTAGRWREFALVLGLSGPQALLAAEAMSWVHPPRSLDDPLLVYVPPKTSWVPGPPTLRMALSGASS